MFELTCTLVAGLWVEAEMVRLQLLLEADEKARRTGGK
jgi:hypothetical protein